jgi:hypothetical protein
MKKIVMSTVAAGLLAALGAPAMAQEAPQTYQIVSERAGKGGSKVIRAVRTDGKKEAIVRVAADGSATGEVDGKTVSVKFEAVQAPRAGRSAETQVRLQVFEPVKETVSADGSKTIHAVRTDGRKQAVVRVSTDGSASATVDGRPVNVRFEQR